MKFLCLHGAYGSANTLRVQLGPMIDLLESEGTASFKFINGRVPVNPPPGFGDYFGPAPHFRFLRDSGEAEKSALEGIRVFPDADTPEDSMRKLAAMGDGIAPPGSRDDAMSYLYETLEADPEISGIIGYSEGAATAASLILDEQERAKSEGLTPRIKCAMFFMGWPALNRDSTIALADERDDTFEVPSLHVVGSKDPYKDGAMALYNLFDEGCAVFFDTAGGHTVPRHGKVLAELVQAVRHLIESARVMRRSDSVVVLPDAIKK